MFHEIGILIYQMLFSKRSKSLSPLISILKKIKTFCSKCPLTIFYKTFENDLDLGRSREIENLNIKTFFNVFNVVICTSFSFEEIFFQIFFSLLLTTFRNQFDLKLSGEMEILKYQMHFATCSSLSLSFEEIFSKCPFGHFLQTFLKDLSGSHV